MFVSTIRCDLLKDHSCFIQFRVAGSAQVGLVNTTLRQLSHLLQASFSFFKGPHVLASVAQFVEHCPIYQMDAGWVPGRGTCPVVGLIPQ